MGRVKLKKDQALGIVRRSSKGQEDNTSAETQKDGIQERCDELALKVEMKNFIESAKTHNDRKKYNEALNYALKNGIYNLVFYRGCRWLYWPDLRVIG